MGGRLEQKLQEQTRFRPAGYRTFKDLLTEEFPFETFILCFCSRTFTGPPGVCLPLAGVDINTCNRITELLMTGSTLDVSLVCDEYFLFSYLKKLMWLIIRLKAVRTSLSERNIITQPWWRRAAEGEHKGKVRGRRRWRLGAAKPHLPSIILLNN